jgi:dCTP deaminase
MRLLTDAELHTTLSAEPPVIEGIDTAQWRGEDSHIQPSSVDLHIGSIFVPGEADRADRTLPKARDSWSLETGATAVIVTHETLRLPANLACIGFPPSKVSSKGLLMTNPGHVDPGYSGKLQFTVINMAEEKMPLQKHQAICTLLIFQLDQDSAAPYGVRVPNLPPLRYDDVAKLSKDFVNVEGRTRKIARGVALKYTLLITGAVALLTFFGGILADRMKNVEDLKERVIKLQEKTDYMQKMIDLKADKK